MNSLLRDRILRTLAFADASEIPLTSFEAWLWLFNYRDRISIVELLDVWQALDALRRNGTIVERWGYFAFPDRQELFEERLRRLQFNSTKLKRAGRWTRWMVHLPYVRGFFAYGSLATGNTKEESDLDVFVVVATGRMFLARLFVSWLTEMVGMRRSGGKIRDRICLNHYVTEDALALPEHYRNLPTAWLWSRMFPLAVQTQAIAEEFQKENAWVWEYFPEHREMMQNLTRKNARDFRAVSRKVSRGFALSPAGFFEKLLRFLQLRRIKKNPLTYKEGGRVVANDAMLIFHPELPEERRLRAYHDRLKKLGVTQGDW